MPQKYRFNSEDNAVISEIIGLIRRVIYSGRLQPAEIISVAKILHVLVNLPCVNENVSVTLELTGNPENQGRFRSFSFSVSNELHLECAPHIDWFPSMEWHAYPGRSPEHDENWESEWMPHFYWSNDPLGFDLKQCVITAEDEDNPLLCGRDDADGNDNEQTSQDTSPGGVSHK